jgi:hypothetical protein
MMRSRNSNPLVYGVLGALAVAVVVLGYLYYQERQRSAEFRIQLDLPGVEGQIGN